MHCGSNVFDCIFQHQFIKASQNLSVGISRSALEENHPKGTTLNRMFRLQLVNPIWLFKVHEMISMASRKQCSSLSSFMELFELLRAHSSSLAAPCCSTQHLPTMAAGKGGCAAATRINLKFRSCFTVEATATILARLAAEALLMP